MKIPRASTLIVGIIWVSFLVSIFVLYISSLTTEYGVDFDTGSINMLNKSNEMVQLSEDLNDASAIKEDSDWLDKIGAYFSAGYGVLVIAFKSVTYVGEMTTGALGSEYINIPSAKLLISAIIASVGIFFILGVLISAIVKKDL